MTSNIECVVLVGGTMWKHGLVHLHFFEEDKYYMPVSKIPEDDKAAVDRAVESGLLKISKKPELSLAHAQRKAAEISRQPIVAVTHIDRLKWKDQEKVIEEGSKRPPKSPSVGSKSATYTNEKSKVFMFLQKPAQHLKKELAGEIGTLNTNKEKEKYLREAEYIESQGYNPTNATRTEIMAEIVRLLKPYNTAPMSMSPIVTLDDDGAPVAGMEDDKD